MQARQFGLLPPLTGFTQRFFSLHQSSADLHRRLRGLLRPLMEFIQPPKEANHPLLGFHQPLREFIQRFHGLHQSLREANQPLKEANQSLPDANQP
jgi:hypothetical protein